VSGMSRNPSQEAKILALLVSRGSAWTPAPDLSHISLQYCRVIACLRKRGYHIENRTEINDGVKRGFYRLAPTQLAEFRERSAHSGDPQPRTMPGQTASLFSNETVRHLDLG
jgi:hypothetical protein